MRKVKNLFKSFGFISIGLCALCCVLPIIGMTMGIGTLTALLVYIEWAGIVAVIVTAILFVIYFLQKRKRHACDIDCACKENTRTAALVQSSLKEREA